MPPSCSATTGGHSPHLVAERWLAALFSFDLRAALMGPIEAALLLAHFHDPRAEITGATNPWGDHIGHTAELAATSRAVLATTSPTHPSAEQIHAGYGSALIAGSQVGPRRTVSR